MTHLPCIRVLLVAVIGLGTACRTTPEAEETAEVKGDSAALAVNLQLNKDEEQQVYLKMLSVELGAGITVPKDQLHSASGLVECHKDGSLENCFLRVRVMADDLSQTQPLAAELSAKVWKFIRANRPELGTEKLVLNDVGCDYIGKKSPPYNVEDVTCVVSLPRSLGEAVFTDPVAEELADALRGESPFGAQAVTLNGSLSCQQVAGSGRTPCTVRANVGGVLAERVTEVNAKIAPYVARRLKNAAMDSLKLSDDPDGKQIVTPPSNVTGSLSCLIDNSKFDADGQRSHVCRTKI